MPPSITFWNRLEPRPRSNSIAESLAAPVRDPLWLLARQWQVGEFAASDCGSPVYVDLHAQAGPFAAWTPAGGASVALTSPAPPLEPTMEDEPFSPDLATRVELGQWFESLIGPNAGLHMIDDLRSNYPLPLVLDKNGDRLFTYSGTSDGLNAGSVPAALLTAFQNAGIPVSTVVVWTVALDARWVVTDSVSGLSYAVVKDAAFSVYLYRDAEALRFLRVCAGRVCDGGGIVNALELGASILHVRPEWTAQQTQALTDAGNTLLDSVHNVYGSIGAGDPDAWSTERLSIEASVTATTGAAAVDVLKATPGPNGEFGWSSFDLTTPSGALAGVTTLDQSIMPGHVRFRGMPNSRWWDFETSQTDFGGIEPEKRDLAKLIFMDFMLIHGDDWYQVPLPAPVGSIVQVGGLFVHDVFGVVTQIDRADATTARAGLAPGQQWTMFSPAWTGAAPRVGSYQVIPSSAWPTAMTGPAIEEVRLLRDPVADMVWGVETVVESWVGRPWPGRERDRAARPAQPEPPGERTVATQLRYQLHTPVPVNWIPFGAAPRKSGNGFVLQRAVLPGDAPATVAPVGRILQTPQVREQEVSTEGTVISRVVCRSRWTDGSTRLWIARRRSFGLGQGSSGLRFDVAAPVNQDGAK